MNETNIIKTISYKSVNTPYNKECEKNWVFYGDNNIIYQWYPLITGKIIKSDNNDNTNDNNTNDTTNDTEFILIKKKKLKCHHFFNK